MKKRFIATLIIDTDGGKLEERDIFEGLNQIFEDEKHLSLKFSSVQDVTQILKK